MLSHIVRRALTAAVVAAAGAAGAYVVRRVRERQQRQALRDEFRAVSRWEGEGGSPAPVTSAAPTAGTSPY